MLLLARSCLLSVSGDSSSTVVAILNLELGLEVGPQSRTRAWDKMAANISFPSTSEIASEGRQSEGPVTQRGQEEEFQKLKSDDFDVAVGRKSKSGGQRMDTSNEGECSIKRPSFPPVSAQQAEGVGSSCEYTSHVS